MSDFEILDDPDHGPPPVVAWLCRWPTGHGIFHASTIEQARLAARTQAGPTVAVSARLATPVEQREVA